MKVLLAALLLVACCPHPKLQLACPATNGRFVRVPQGAIHVSVYGAELRQKPIVVLVHGWARDGSVFYPQIAALAGRYTIVAVDLRGHGDSTDDRHGGGDLATHAHDLEAVLGQLDRPVHLVGHDLGALIALRVAIDQPKRVLSLTLLSPPLVPDERIRTSYEQLIADYKVDPTSYHLWSGLTAG